ncbi:MAG TPA: cation transporter [Polyangia bacterium]
MTAHQATHSGRPELLAHALRLEYLTVGWNIIEGGIAVTAALAASSVALFGFGIDSFVESASGSVLIWRLLAERSARSHSEIEKLDRRAHKLVAFSLFALAAWVMFDGVQALVMKDRPETSVIGIVLTSVSAAVMMWLARAKRRAARALGSRAMEADSFQTTACWWLSIITLAGVTLNATLGWWWADPVAGLGMTLLLLKEGREAWKGEDDCCA